MKGTDKPEGKYRTEEKDGCTAAGGFYQGGHSLDHCSGIYFIIYQ